MKSNKEQLRRRGYIEENELVYFKEYTKTELFELLKSKISTNRTIAAKLLSEVKEVEVIKVLISSLVIENKLYTKIALSESIGSYGKDASIFLIKYLGKVGNNQHRSLPNKYFNKKNYPLPRDIIARTLCKIGKSAIEELRWCLYNGEYNQVLEAIDAIGYISYYEKDTTCMNDIIELLQVYKDDDLVTWKLVRALQAFKCEKVINLLQRYTASNVSQIKWEAVRSIKQIQRM